MKPIEDPTQRRRIVGVVTALGVAGVCLAQEGWVVAFHVRPWRVDGGTTQKTELRVTKPMPKEQIDRLSKSIPGLTVISFTASGFAPFYKDSQSATLGKFLEFACADPEMAEASAQLRVPVERHNTTLGVLRLDRCVDTFEAELLYAGNVVSLMLDSIADEPDPSQLSVAESVWNDISAFDESARQCAAASRLLALKNESWLDDGEHEVTEAEFRARMALKYISFSHGGEFTFSYDDGELFHGHSIDVCGSLESGFSDASING